MYILQNTVKVQTACRVRVPQLRETHDTMREWERTHPIQEKNYLKNKIFKKYNIKKIK